LGKTKCQGRRKPRFGGYLTIGGQPGQGDREKTKGGKGLAWSVGGALETGGLGGAKEEIRNEARKRSVREKKKGNQVWVTKRLMGVAKRTSEKQRRTQENMSKVPI